METFHNILIDVKGDPCSSQAMLTDPENQIPYYHFFDVTSNAPDAYKHLKTLCDLNTPF